MAVIFQWILCLALLISSVLQAEDKLPAPPDPQGLEASWWLYYQPDEKVEKADLDARIKKTYSRLKESLKAVKSDQRRTLMPQVKKIHENLKQFSNLQDETITDTLPQLVTAEKYTIDQAMDRFLLWRKLKNDLDLEKGDMLWQRAQLALERKRQSNRRNNYLKLAISDPQRLSAGIELMANRVSLELAALQNKRREAKSKVSNLQTKRLQEELDNIHLRLGPSSTTNEAWEKEQSRETAKLNAIRQQPEVTVDEQSPGTPLGSANIKYMLLVSAGKEVQSGVHELAAMRYQMMHALDRSLTVQIKQDNESLPQISKNFMDLKQSIKERQHSWHSLTEQSKKFASAQAANLDRSDPVLSQAYKRLLKQADENDRTLHELELEQGVGNFLLQLAQLKTENDAGWFRRWQINTKMWLVKSWGLVNEWLNATLFEVNEAPVTPMGLLSVLFIITVAWFISKMIRQGLEKLGQRNDGVSASSLYTLGRVIHYIVLILGIIIGLSSIGIDFTKFALFASALGVGIGFGLQTLISNFVAGLLILFERSLKVGDFIELATGLLGEVKEINMRSTLITTNDNVDILVPNSEFINTQVTNWTLRDTIRRIHVPFGVAYGTDKDTVKKAVLEAADEVKWTLKDDKKIHQPQIWFVKFGDSSLNFELVVWLKAEAVKRPGAVQAAYLWEIESKLKEYGIEIPFPQRDLHLRSVFGQKDEAGITLWDKQNEAKT